MNAKVDSCVVIWGAGSSFGGALGARLGRDGAKLCLVESVQRRSALERSRSSIQAEAPDASITTLLVDNESPETIIEKIVSQCGGIGHYVDFFVPNDGWSESELTGYPPALLKRITAFSERLVQEAKDSPRVGTAVLHCCLPSAYADTRFDAFMPMLKGAITGITRSMCRRFAPDGLVINCLQTGLVKDSDTQELLSARVKAVSVPVGAWAEPSEVAETAEFLLLGKGYLNGQAVVFDGGLTSGITGT